MRLVTVTGNVVELNYMWLPTWIGQNAQLKRDLEKYMRPLVEGRELTDVTLQDVDELILGYLEEKYPYVEGLRDYLDGLKFVRLVDADVG